MFLIMRKGFFLFFFFFIFLTYGDDWWNESWHYRGIIEIPSVNFERENFPIEININFSKIFSFLNIKGNLDINSIRIIENNKEVPYSINKIDEGRFTIEWIMEGKTLENQIRKYEIYFDTIENGRKTRPLYKILPSSNLIINGSFEDGNQWPIGWTGKELENDELVIKWDKEQFHTGKKSIYLERKTLGIVNTQITSPIIIYPSYKYIFEYWSKTSKYKIGSAEREGGSLGIGFAIYYDNEKKCLGQIGLPGGNKQKEEWEKFRTICSFPLNARYVVIQIEIWKGIGSVYFDDIIFKPDLNLKLEKVQEKGKEIREIREKEWFE
ncbi:MAG: hypothetical protein ACP5OB_08055 [Candidatus Ratteibacteria bacterium]